MTKRTKKILREAKHTNNKIQKSPNIMIKSNITFITINILLKITLRPSYKTKPSDIRPS